MTVSVLVALLCATAAEAQVEVPGISGPWLAPGWVGDVTFLSANALIGGLTAGTLQHLRGKSFQDGFARGAAGGAVAYTGRRIGAAGFDGAGLVGRQVSAVGVSVVRNASEDRPSLERVFLPLGPVSLHLDRRESPAVRVKLGVGTTATMIAMAFQPELELDAGASLSAGAPVFRAPAHRIVRRGQLAAGVEALGVILLSGGVDPWRQEEVFAHERVHVLQHDFLDHVLSDPLEGWLLSKLPGGSTLHGYVDFGVTAGVGFDLLLRALDVRYENHPHEIEAHFLGSRR